MHDTPYYDAVIVGAGFGGIYQLYSLLKLGLSVRVLEKGDDLGGTWFWNRYPGAMSDTQSFLYRYSWDKEDLSTYPWADNYLDAKDILAYLNHVVERHNLREHMQFGVEVLSAKWQEADGMWLVGTQSGPYRARYLVTSIGLLSEVNWPAIPGRETFRGQMYHTARWPEHYDFARKRVGVIGNGSTGVQLITKLGKEEQVKSLICFQRHPQYSVPAGRRAVTKEERELINSTYDDIWARARLSFGGMGVEESKTPAMSVTPEERERVYQAAWDEGGGIRFFLGTFSDITVNEQANQTACDFIKRKIGQIVKDPAKRQKLLPTELYIRRPLCDTGYYEQFNRDNVDIVDIGDNPIAEFVSGGIRLSNGTIHELDVIICATGFNAFDGAYRKIHIQVRDGLLLNDHWSKGATSNMGVSVSNFPNLLMILGPQSPLGNVPPMIEAHVDFITAAIARAEDHRRQKADPSSSPITIETTTQAEVEWGRLCAEISDKTLFKKSPSYFYGANVEGKVRSVLIFLGGLGPFVQKLRESREGGFAGFHPF
jgi:cation diffusion facilitator CzcD-associated flavoprotein CzcO